MAGVERGRLAAPDSACGHGPLQAGTHSPVCGRQRTPLAAGHEHPPDAGEAGLRTARSTRAAWLSCQSAKHSGVGYSCSCLAIGGVIPT